MYVYFIRCVGTSFIKIGKANNCSNRLAGLQTGCPHTLAIMFTIKCDSEAVALRTERGLHRTFGAFRVRDEWFDIPAAVIQKMNIQESVDVGEFYKSYVTPRAQRRKKRREKRATQGDRHYERVNEGFLNAMYKD